MRRILLAAVLLCPWVAPTLAAQVDARMFRYPDVSATQITFVYAGDIWLVPRQGGVATRLSSPTGEESFPRFSPDGSRIAYTAEYDGNTDIYVIPTVGGEPFRVTHHPLPDRLVDWYPDGKTLLMASSMASGSQRFNQLYRVPATGGMPGKLPVPYGEFGAISPDGTTLAYMPETNDFRTWKRYRGGWAPDIWLFDLKTLASENITHDPGNDAQPMWHGRTLYFLSDRDSVERNNIWAYDLDSKKFREVTHFTDFDVTFPAIGPDAIVFQAGGRLYLLDLATEKTTEVKVTVVTDEITLRPRAEKVAKYIQDATISPTGQRALFEARGDLFTVPAEHGPVLDLTSSAGVFERSPAWSPDGKTIAYWSDRSGEYELYVRPADGSAPERKITSYGPGFRYQLFWSPDSRKLAFVDQTMTIRIVDVTSGTTTTVDRNLYMFQGALDAFAPSWSADSRWLAYSKDTERNTSAIALFDTRTGKSQQVTSGFYNDQTPVFDPDGKYLYFLSNRTFDPVYSDIDDTWIYPNGQNIVAVALRGAVASPLAPRDDEEGAKSDSGAKGEAQGAPAHKGASAAADTTKKKITPVDVDLADFERRLVVLPPRPGHFASLSAVSGKVIYRRTPNAGAADSASPIGYYDLTEREDTTVVADADGYVLSSNGKKLLIWKKDRFGIVDVKPKQRIEKPLRTAELEMVVDPRAEWKQIFNDVWRFERDMFYDPKMHGVDWNAMRTRYGKLMDDAVTRWDVNFVLGELIAELSSSHTYRAGGDLEAAPHRGVGLLGVDWTLSNGAWRIAKIIRGAPWDNEVRSPLDEPGVNVHEGDYVLAVNGIPMDPAQDPWAAFGGLADQTVQLTVNDRPGQAGARTVLVKTLPDETRLRNLAWIDANRRRVDEATGGRVGYIYVPNTGTDGQTELVRQFMGQFGKSALIIDERFNSGGQIPDRFVELLNRPFLSWYAVRDGKDWQWPPQANFGPKVMLINGWSGSGGDAFPLYFKRTGVGPLIGERTWGGLIGITGAPTLIDGGSITVPTFREYSAESKWFPEGHGVEPDIAVVDDPTELAKGRDPQLERAITEVDQLLKTHPAPVPRRPAAEDRTRP